MPPRCLPSLQALGFLATFCPVFLVSAAPPVDSVVVFNEIMYHPTDPAGDGEWIEFHNQMGINVDLSDWQITGGINYTFPDGTVIPGGGYLVIAKDPGMLPSVSALGPWTGSLDNGGETIRLRDKNERLMDELSYSDSGDWPVGPDGGGVTLAKPHEDSSSPEAGNWSVSQQVGGTPGAVNFPPPPAAVTARVIGLHDPWKYNSTGTDPGPTWKEPAYNDTVAGWLTGNALFQYGNPTIYDDYVGAPPAPTGYSEVTCVTIAGFSTEAVGGTSARAAVNCINGSGLSNGKHGTVAPGNMWMTNGNSLVLTPKDPLPADISFDLGSNQNLTSIHVWNYNEAGSTNLNRGSKTVEIFVASTVGGPLTSTGIYTFNQASGLATEAGQDIPFVQNNVRQVKFLITANWGNTTQYAGLSEVKFYNNVPSMPPPPVHRESMAEVLPNTGANADGSLITPGQRDPHYINTADNQGAYVQNGHPAWLGGDGISQWLGSTPNGTDNVPAISTTYRLAVDLTYWKKETATIQLYAAGDNSFDRLRINNILIAGVPGVGTSFDKFYGPFAIPTTNLINGSNNIELDWTNAGGGPNPGGFRAKWIATAEPNLARTVLASNPLTTRYRRKFTYAGDPAATYQLRLQHIIDDGAVFYLNGQEIYRINMPAGAVTNTTPATTEIQYPRFSPQITVPGTAFVVGENTLAVEVHQPCLGNSDALFGATLDITETPPVPSAPPTLSINEVAGSSAASGGFFLELRNTGPSSLSLLGYRVTGSNGGVVVLGNVTLPAGGLLSLNEATLGFRPALDEKLFVFTPSQSQIVDAVVVKTSTHARTAEQLWEWPQSATPGAANVFATTDAIIINEIMYEHMPVYAVADVTPDPEEWVELYNRTASIVSLEGWHLKGGADFAFPTGTSIPAGEYLVVAKNKLALAAKYPGITIVGDWSGGLSNKEDTVRLNDAAGNTVNVVHYFGSGRWDARASGGGSSLELLHPQMDNSQPEAWMGSDETSKAAWQTISYHGQALPTPGASDPTAYNEFIAGMITNGECLLDDISVIDEDDSGSQLIQDGAFTSGNASKWRLLGTHGHSVMAMDGGNPALRLIATGPSEHMHNHAETTLRKSGGNFPVIDSNHQFTISFRAKWQSGSPRLQTRLYFNRLVRQHLLTVPMNNGTPGAPNSRLVAQAPPTLFGIQQTPIIPEILQDVTLGIAAESRVPLASVVLKWRLDGTATWTDVPAGALTAGSYTATIPGQAASSLVQFYFLATATNGATSTYPAGGENSRAMIRWNDGHAPPGPGYGVRILMPTADADFLHSITNAMSNDFIPCTIVYRENEVFYDAGVRLKSSERGRYGDPRLGFAISFDPTHKFRGVHEIINMDRSAYGQGTTGSGSGQVDIINQIFAQRAGGVPAMYNDLVYLVSPKTAHIGSAQMTMAEYNDTYLDSQWNNGGNSPTFKFDLVYYPTTTTGGPEGLKNAQPDDVRGVNIGQIPSLDKEDFRWYFLITNARTGDDYSRIVAMNQAFAQLAVGDASTIASAIDIDQWLRASAAMSLIGSNDSYSTGGLPHNLKLYVRPDDGRVLYLPWDADFFKMDATYAVAGNADLQRIIAANPVWKRMLYGHLHDLMNTSFNTTYLTSWVNHLSTYNTVGGNWNEILTYVQDRNNFVTSDCSAQFPLVNFEITTNGGADFSSPDPLVTLTGNGWIDVREIRISGTATPLVVTWLTQDTWQVQVPVVLGLNPFTLEAYDYQGQLVGNDTITITGTGNVVPASRDNVVFSEVHYHPALAPAGGFTSADDFEFIELQNTTGYIVDLSGCYFDTGLTYTFAGGTRIQPNARIVLPRRSSAFAFRHPGVATVAEYYVLNANTLRDGGEEISLVSPSGQDIQRFTYDDKFPWPTQPDGTGRSLVLISPLSKPDHGDPLSWRASLANDGSPGFSEGTPFTGSPTTDTDHDGLSDLVEAGIGVDGEIPRLEAINESLMYFTFDRDAARQISSWVELSSDLKNVAPTGWARIVNPTIVSRQVVSGNVERITLALDVPPGTPRQFYRMCFTAP